jgi:NAD(P)-dependent dehydrogenase (short-subunit alcohol dehydrogenase family)
MRRNDTGWKIAAAGLGVVLGGAWLRRRLMRYDLRGKTALVTGGGRGLGLLVAQELAKKGANVVICGRDPDTLHRAVTWMAERGVRIDAMQCDVSDAAQVARLVDWIEMRHGGIDVLVNNAGRIEVGPVETMTRDDHVKAMSTHFWGPLNAMLAVIPRMKVRGGGRIVNVSSIGGIVAVPHLLPYCASKFALRGLSEGMRAELAASGIVVTTVCPGLMRTGSPCNARFKGDHRAEYAWFRLGDALPVCSMQANRAARQIVAACREGRGHVVLSVQAKLVALAEGIFPGMVGGAMGVVHRLLPGPVGSPHASFSGAESASRASESWLTTLDRRAAIANNELPAVAGRPSHP